MNPLQKRLILIFQRRSPSGRRYPKDVFNEVRPLIDEFGLAEVATAMIEIIFLLDKKGKIDILYDYRAGKPIHIIKDIVSDAAQLRKL